MRSPDHSYSKIRVPKLQGRSLTLFKGGVTASLSSEDEHLCKVTVNGQRINNDVSIIIEYLLLAEF